MSENSFGLENSSRFSKGHCNRKYYETFCLFYLEDICYFPSEVFFISRVRMATCGNIFIWSEVKTILNCTLIRTNFLSLLCWFFNENIKCYFPHYWIVTPSPLVYLYLTREVIKSGIAKILDQTREVIDDENSIQ